VGIRGYIKKVHICLKRERREGKEDNYNRRESYSKVNFVIDGVMGQVKGEKSVK
jgi:hypothetical protein